MSGPSAGLPDIWSSPASTLHGRQPMYNEASERYHDSCTDVRARGGAGRTRAAARDRWRAQPLGNAPWAPPRGEAYHLLTRLAGTTPHRMVYHSQVARTAVLLVRAHLRTWYMTPSNRHCPDCGRPVTLDQRFCSTCGAPLDDVAGYQQQSPHPLESPRRQAEAASGDHVEPFVALTYPPPPPLPLMRRLRRTWRRWQVERAS